MTAPGAHGEGEGVVVWRYPNCGQWLSAPAIPADVNRHPSNVNYTFPYRARPLGADDALLARLREADARANAAAVAADLMRARAEKAERERDAMREERDDAIGRTSMERYSDGRVGEARMESVVYKLGVCSGWYFDDYDCSVEMLGVRNGWLPTKDERDLLSATGISIAWLSYLDGTGVMVHLTTGQHGPCSPRGSKSDKSALVAKLEHERDEARAALSTQRGEGGA